MSRSAFWQQAWDDAQPQIDAIRQSLESVRPSEGRELRVGQLDAEILDQELLQILKVPLEKALGLISTGWDTFAEPELTLILQILLYKYSIWDSGSTYGAKLQSLRYSIPNSKARGSYLTPSGLPAKILCLHGVMTIVLPYVDRRIRTHALSNAWPDAPSFDARRRLWELLMKVESTHASVGLLSFIMFLWNGRYRTIADRILGLRLVPSRALLNRNVSYEFMNRQMVWHAFTEFLLFLLPIINTRSLRRRVVRAVSNFKWINLLPSQTRPQRSSSNRDMLTKRGRYSLLPENECAICAEDASMDLSLLRDSKGPIQNPSISDQSRNIQDPSLVTPTYPLNNPYKTSCGHVYCYVCISDRIFRAADEGEKYWECLRCDEKITHASRRDAADLRLGRRAVRSAGSGDSAHVQQGWGGDVSSSMSRLGVGGYGTSELDDSELSALDLDSVSSMEPRTHSGSDDLSE